MSHEAGQAAGRLAMLVGGGPAPGINGVIAAATRRARQAGLEVLGLPHGYSQIMQGRTENVRSLDEAAVAGLHLRGGVVLGTSRANPTRRPQDLERALATLTSLGVTRLVTIGGDDTAFSAMKLAAHAGERLRVAHVPKTIDNDLALPPHVDTFGFQTARHVGAQLVGNLLADARASGRWIFAVAMGRKAGALALGIGKAAGAHVCVIPEEFAGCPVQLSDIADVLVGAILKRLAQGARDGVAVLAEGLAELIPEDELHRLGPVERDEHNHIRLAEIDLGKGLRRVVEQRLQELGLKFSIISKDIGYELRCADPIAFDVEYTQDLGYCAAEFLICGGSSALISLQEGRFVPIPFKDLLDPLTGHTRVRTVDVSRIAYGVARGLMTRLEASDLADPASLAALASAAGMSAEAFRERFSASVPGAPAFALSASSMDTP